MKNTVKILFGALLFGSMVACQPEEYDSISIDGVPSASNYKINATVDQETNQVVLTLMDQNNQVAKNAYPIYSIEAPDGSKTSATGSYAKILTAAGEYKVSCKVGNRNGISDTQTSEYSFFVEKSLVNYDKYYSMISKADWYLDNKAKGHLACGPDANDPAGWWAAGPDEKAAFGVYDNVLTFTADGKYTFKPGDAGTIYVNKDATDLGPQADEDYNVPATEQTYEYSFDVEGNDLVLILTPKCFFPYIANNEIYENPRYKVINMTAKTMTLVCVKEGIAWQYILTTSHEVAFNGFKYNSEFNLWKSIDDAKDYETHYYYAPGWNQIADPEYKQNGSSYSVSLPEATSDQWQAQCAIKPNALALSADKKYDFSCVISSTTDIKGVTVKLTSVESGDNFVFAERVDITAFDDKVFFLSDVNSLSSDANCELFFDFGGNPAATDVTIKDIVVKDHANDDGTVLPSVEEPAPAPQVSWTGANILEGMPIEITQWYAPGWNQIADAEYTAKDGVYTIKYPEAASDQWMAQFTFNNTGIALDPTKSYDFRMKIVSSTDHPGVTVKITQQDNDDVYITQDRHALVAFEETWIELADLKFNKEGEISNLKMPFDFGGVEAGTEITISDMHLQEHQGPKTIAWDLTGEKNLWLKGAHETISFYYAPGWNQIADPETKIAGNSYTITLPAATTDQWQAQWHISTELGKADISADKKYNVRFTIVSDQDQPGITFKFTENGNDDNFLTADRHAGVAYEETVIELTDLSLSKGDITNESFKLALDFAGNPENSEITIKDIIIQEAE